MAENSYPKPIEEVITTLADICRHQNEHLLVDICMKSQARMELTDYDNWNGGTSVWALMLEVPIPLFAQANGNLEATEKTLHSNISALDKLHPNDCIGAVKIAPLTSKAHTRAPAIEGDRLWDSGLLRLFLSHKDEHKKAVAALKAELKIRGISAFVAHDDIEPTNEWMDEIELGLRSMDALAALLTPKFHESNWTDQEIGWALGRDVLVLPVRLGIDPYGFGGKYQGISGNLDNHVSLAMAIVQILASKPKTKSAMRRGLITAFCDSGSYNMAIELWGHLKDLEFTSEEKAILLKAHEENDQISGSVFVSPKLRAKVGNPIKAVRKDDVPF